MEDKLTLTTDEINQIKMVNEEASKATADALAKLISKKTKYTYPTMSLKPIDEVSKLKSDDLFAICEIVGDVSGNIMIAYPKDQGLKLVDFMMMQEPGTLKEINEDVVSAYKEFVNIVGGAYLSDLANFLAFKIFPSVPKFTGELNQVQKEMLEEFKQDVGKLLMLSTNLQIEDEQMSGSFLIIFNEDSLKKIIQTIRDQS